MGRSCVVTRFLLQDVKLVHIAALLGYEYRLIALTHSSNWMKEMLFIKKIGCMKCLVNLAKMFCLESRLNRATKV